MRCLSCDKVLSDFESTRKYANTQKYVDLCNHCYSTVQQEIQTVDRLDLINAADCLEEELE